MPVSAVRRRAIVLTLRALARIATPPFTIAWYNDQNTWRSTTWMNLPIWKCPFDLWMYQALLVDVRPDLLIESGTAFGGSALYFAQLFDILGHGKVRSIDLVTREQLPIHPRIEYATGSSTDPVVAEQIRSACSGCVFVSLDSDHSEAHVASELDVYGPLVTSGSYMVVEDTALNGHPVYRTFGPGPMEALDGWLPMHPEFKVDERCERMMLTTQPRGYVRRQ